MCRDRSKYPKLGLSGEPEDEPEEEASPQHEEDFQDRDCMMLASKRTHHDKSYVHLVRLPYTLYFGDGLFNTFLHCFWVWFAFGTANCIIWIHLDFSARTNGRVSSLWVRPSSMCRRRGFRKLSLDEKCVCVCENIIYIYIMYISLKSNASSSTYS